MLFWLACGHPADIEDTDVPVAPLDAAVLARLDWQNIKTDVDFLASDDLGGRVPGSPGHAAAADYVEAAMADAGLEPLVADGFRVHHELHLSRSRLMLDESGAIVPTPDDVDGVQLLGAIPGTDPVRSNEIVLVMAHYDHLGVDAGGSVYTGAMDDATGVAGVLELARILRDSPLPRTVAFLITDAEEDGLTGSEAWVADPRVALDDVAVALAIDPLGRPLLPDYDPIAVLGAEHSAGISAILGETAPFSPVDVLDLNRDPLVLFGSDQDSFWDAGRPALWIASPGMTFYHMTTDRPETIDYRSVLEHLAFIGQLTAAFARDDGAYTDEGPKALSVEDCAAVVAFADALLESEVLTDEERTTAVQYRADFQHAVETGVVEDSLKTEYLQAILFVIGGVARAHPGEIPPPTPD